MDPRSRCKTCLRPTRRVALKCGVVAVCDACALVFCRPQDESKLRDEAEALAGLSLLRPFRPLWPSFAQKRAA